MGVRAAANAQQLDYSSFGAAVSEVEVDVLTGEKLILQSDILFDCGHSFNPAGATILLPWISRDCPAAQSSFMPLGLNMANCSI